MTPGADVSPDEILEADAVAEMAAAMLDHLARQDLARQDAGRSDTASQG